MDQKWRSTKDKYEKAALEDITKETKDKKMSSEGDTIFKVYAEKAEHLLANDEFNKLQNKSMTVEKLRSAKERLELKALKTATSELQKEDAIALKLRHKALAKKQFAAEKRFEEQLKQTMKDLNSPQKYDHSSKFTIPKSQDIARHETNHVSLDEDYRNTYKEAEKVEAARRKAFLKEVQILRDRDEDEVIKRAKLLQKESEKGVKMKEDAKARADARARIAKRMLTFQRGEVNRAEVDESKSHSRDEDGKRDDHFAETARTLREASENMKQGQHNAFHALDLSSNRYHASVNSMLNADKLRSLEERKRRLAYHTKREQILLKDHAKEKGIADALAKTSASLLEVIKFFPSNYINLLPAQSAVGCSAIS
eukprot:751534-Hanusia_phi.AAC.6